MSDDAQTPEARENAAHASTPAGGAGEPADAPHDPWAAPADPAPKTWPTPPQDAVGPGATVADSGAVPLAEAPPTSTPSSSVHDQQTVTSMPGTDGTTPVDATPPGAGPTAPRPWSSPFAPPNPTAPANGSDNPFAPPNPAAPVPPGPAGAFPGYGQGQVSPPPMAPDGPGQAPYGHPGAYGYPGALPSYGAHAPQSHGPGGYYGWPGMAPTPNNGMGTASLVLGIISTVIFCLWPFAIVAGVLALVFGTIARKKVRRGEATNPGQALAGMICGSVGLALGIGLIVLLVAAS